MEHPTTLGARLAAAREQKGLDQATLARELGVHEKTISKWENDKQLPREAQLSKLADLLEVPAAWLRYGTADDRANRGLPVTLKAARKNAGWTIPEVAEILDVSDRTVANWESGASLPDSRALAVLARVYGWSVESLRFPHRVPGTIEARIDQWLPEELSSSMPMGEAARVRSHLIELAKIGATEYELKRAAKLLQDADLALFFLPRRYAAHGITPEAYALTIERIAALLKEEMRRRVADERLLPPPVESTPLSADAAARNAERLLKQRHERDLTELPQLLRRAQDAVSTILAHSEPDESARPAALKRSLDLIRRKLVAGELDPYARAQVREDVDRLEQTAARWHGESEASTSPILTTAPTPEKPLSKSDLAADSLAERMLLIVPRGLERLEAYEEGPNIETLREKLIRRYSAMGMSDADALKRADYFAETLGADVRRASVEPKLSAHLSQQMHRLQQLLALLPDSGTTRRPSKATQSKINEILREMDEAEDSADPLRRKVDAVFRRQSVEQLLMAELGDVPASPEVRGEIAAAAAELVAAADRGVTTASFERRLAAILRRLQARAMNPHVEDEQRNREPGTSSRKRARKTSASARQSSGKGRKKRG